MKKRVVNCMLAVMMVFALTACGQKEEAQAEPEAVQTEESQESDDESSAAEEALETQAIKDTSEDSQETPETEDTSEDSQETQETEELQGEQTETDGKTLVIYFSASGNTRKVAGYLADTLGADTYEIVPEEPYTSEDLDWTDSESRVSKEHADPDSRPALGGEPVELEGYDRIFLGYPIWWGEAPNIVRTFMEDTDLSGKTIIPFCTSSSSDLGSSAENLKAFAPDADWQEGQRFKSSAKEEDVAGWVNSL